MIVTNINRYKDGRLVGKGWKLGAVHVWEDYDKYIALCKGANIVPKQISENWYKQFGWLCWQAKKKDKNPQ